MKKIVTLTITAAMIAALGTAAFATEDNPIVDGDKTTLSDNAAVKELRFKSEEAIKSDIEEKITDETVILDLEGNVKAESDIKNDDKLMAFYDGEKLSYVVIKDDESITNVYIDLFKKSETLGDFVDTQNYLAINISDETEIVDMEGKKLTSADIENKYLAIFYDITTMSIPAISNPSKIIVLDVEDIIGGADDSTDIVVTATPAPAETEGVELYKLSVDKADVIEKDGINLIPVRKYAEGMDLEVVWNGEDMSVTIGTVPMGVSFKIGENSYSKSKMTPAVLEIAPQLINDTTYVPASFFEDILEAEVTIG